MHLYLLFKNGAKSAYLYLQNDNEKNLLEFHSCELPTTVSKTVNNLKALRKEGKAEKDAKCSGKNKLNNVDQTLFWKRIFSG